MSKQVITVKIETEALRLLRLIAATTDERQYAVITRLLSAEAVRLNIKVG